MKKQNKYNEMNVDATENSQTIELFEIARDIADHLPEYVRIYKNLRKINVWKIMNRKAVSIKRAQQLSTLVQDFLSDNPNHPYHSYLIINRGKMENSDESDD